MAGIRDLTDQDISVIKGRALRGDKYSDIASDYRLNQGRIADIKFGRIRPDILPSGVLPGEIKPDDDDDDDPQGGLFS